jgi:hypothetical protein
VAEKITRLPQRKLPEPNALHQLKERSDPRIAAAEAAAAAALHLVQHWTAWALIEAAAGAAAESKPGSAEQLQILADRAAEGMADTENVRSAHRAWEQLDQAVTNWASLAGLVRKQAV